VFVAGRAQIVALLTSKWERELDYALRKNLWSFDGNRIAVRLGHRSWSHPGTGCTNIVPRGSPASPRSAIASHTPG
jgi:hypothetical protein